MFGWFRKSDHGRLRELLSTHVDGRLSAQEKIRVERHLEECEECRQELEFLEFTVNLLRRVPTVQVPRSFVLTEAPGERPLLAAWPLKAMSAATVLAAVFLVTVFTIDLLDLFVQETVVEQRIAATEEEALTTEAQEPPAAAPQEEIQALAPPEEIPAPQPVEEEAPTDIAPEAEEVQAPLQIEEEEFPFLILEMALLGGLIALGGVTAYVVWVRVRR